eukprot:sb/3463063/
MVGLSESNDDFGFFEVVTPLGGTQVLFVLFWLSRLCFSANLVKPDFTDSQNYPLSGDIRLFCQKVRANGGCHAQIRRRATKGGDNFKKSDFRSRLDYQLSIMNLELLESFGTTYPDDADGFLESGSMTLTCAFNRHGSLLAAGSNDGCIVIFDIITRGIARNFQAHVHPVCSLSWSRNGFKLLSGSMDWTISVWEVLKGECLYRYRFPSPILRVQFHPILPDVFLVCPMKLRPVLLKIGGEQRHITFDEEGGEQNIFASFDRLGKRIFTGNSRGKVLVFEADTLNLLTSFQVTTGSSTTTGIKSIEFARKGSNFLVNSSDRVIRVYDGDLVKPTDGKPQQVEPVQKLQDLVNRTQWKKCCFSGDAEFICAGSSRQHDLYIWDMTHGNLVKILHGQKGEHLLDAVWHPNRPLIASVANGIISVWAQTHAENWSAYAPNFKELDENEEYEERESEFDVEDEDKSVEDAGEEMEDVAEVDVVTCEPIRAYLDSDIEEEEEVLTFIPVTPDVKDPEDGYWAMTDEELANLEKMKRDEERREKTMKEKIKIVDVPYEGHPIPDVPPEPTTKKQDIKAPKAPKTLQPKPPKEQLPPPPLEKELNIPDIDKESNIFTEDKMHCDDS